MEKVPAFEFEAPGSLTLDKFQLFNEWGFHFYGGNSDSFPVVMIEPVNNDPGFYSKWIFGFDFDGIFPIGTQIRFNTPFLEFSNTRRTYTVVGNKMNAILIISDLDNKTVSICASITNFFKGLCSTSRKPSFSRINPPKIATPRYAKSSFNFNSTAYDLYGMDSTIVSALDEELNSNQKIKEFLERTINMTSKQEKFPSQRDEESPVKSAKRKSYIISPTLKGKKKIDQLNIEFSLLDDSGFGSGSILDD